MGCHRYEGFDRETDSLARTRGRDQPARRSDHRERKQIRLIRSPPESGTTTKKRKSCWRMPKSAVTNSLLAARIDQLNLQSKYLMQDQKKVGPNLKDVRLKLRKEWVPVWLRIRRRFVPARRCRPSGVSAMSENPARTCATRMARIRSRPSPLISGRTGFDGKTSRTATRRCRPRQRTFRDARLSRLSLDRRRRQQDWRHFAANLQRSARKGKLRLHRALDSQPARTRGALLSERKARSDGEDYAKNNLPYVFDTELHSRCPNDGAELQVQNMTVMPNFRLSETDARDIATYLFSLSSPPVCRRLVHGRSELKRRPALIKQYGCAGCHEIKGFEEEQRIGKELTVEGATPIERLDFALANKDAEEGIDPLKLRPGRKKKRKEKPWYNHKGFFEHKITQPSIYDEGKEKDPKDRCACRSLI
jgi:hypothetical protein